MPLHLEKASSENLHCGLLQCPFGIFGTTASASARNPAHVTSSTSTAQAQQ
jgi:hypothetical protein